jgi:large subunit ribosomal protein L29
MKPGKWRDLSADEIDQKVRELGEEIFNLRFQLSMGVAKNPSRLREARRDLARAKTIQGERARVEAPAGRAVESARAATPAKRAKKG